MRTYTAFGLLALASSTALSAPTSPDLSRELSLPSSAPNSPDPSGNGEMAAFPSFSAHDFDSDAPMNLKDLPNSLTGMSTDPDATHMSFQEYEAWLASQKSVPVPAKTDANSFTVPTSKKAKAFGTAPDTSANPDPDTESPNGIDGLERMGQESSSEDGQDHGARPFLALGQRDLPVDKVKQADPKTLPAKVKDTTSSKLPASKLPETDTKDLPAKVKSTAGKTATEQQEKHKEVLQKLAPARLKHSKRELPIAIGKMHMNHTQAEMPNLPTRPKQIAALARRMRRATLSEQPSLADSVKQAVGSGSDYNTTGIHRMLRTNATSPLAESS